MNRERAETFLRLLAEAELREWAPRTRGTGDLPFVTMPVALPRAAWALTAVGALDLATAEDILADTDLALDARRPPERAEGPASGPSAIAGPRRFAGIGFMSGSARRRAAAAAPPQARLGQSSTSRSSTGQSSTGQSSTGQSSTGQSSTGQSSTGQSSTGQSGTDRYVPIGRMILFHDETISGELDLMSYVHTASGARLIAAWQTRDPLGSRPRGLPPVEDFTVTDDRGKPYELRFAAKGRRESACDLALSPEPPPDIRWLDLTAPGEQAVRIDLAQARAGAGATAQDGKPEPSPSELSPTELSPTELSPTELSPSELSAGEQLLHRIADRLLTMVPDYPPPTVPAPLINLVAGLGTTIAALEAAEVLPGRSPVPGQLAALCASLGVGGHGITAEPAPDLPEPWLSVLSHYRRRKPETAPALSGFAALAATLPDFDGITLVLLGLHHAAGATWVSALAHGRLPRHQPGPLRAEVAFPLSIWIRDDAGRWHVARPAGWHDDGGEAALTLRLTPPLTRATDVLEVRAAGLSAQARAAVPVQWGYRP